MSDAASIPVGDIRLPTTRQLTPNEITDRAEEYLRTGEVSAYGDLGFIDLQEFWAEVWRAKNIQERRAS